MKRIMLWQLIGFSGGVHGPGYWEMAGRGIIFSTIKIIEDP
jgi:hypothetical protein